VARALPLFEWRGVVEGFYGPPWAHEDRCWMIEFLGRHGHNTYVYAPKSDPKHRDQWREPYDTDERERFAELVATGRAAGVTIGFGISPGLDMAFSSPADMDALVAKVEPLLELGVGMVSLLFDDIPVEQRSADPAADQAQVANGLRVRTGDVPFLLCPTDYIGTRATDYLRRLGKELDPSIPIGWTGPEVTSPVITAADAATMAADVGRPLVLFDNFPVNDGPMRLDLKLGPYPRRDPALADHCSSFLLNPSLQCRASAIAVASAGEWCADPDGYAPDEALDRAVAEVAPGAASGPAFSAMAEAFRWSHVDRRPAPRLSVAIENLFDRWPTGDWFSAATALADALDVHVAAAGVLERELEDRRLWDELQPWAVQQATGATVMRGVLGILLAARPGIEGTWTGTRFDGRVVVPWDRGIVRQAAIWLERWQDSFGAHLRAYGARVSLSPLVHYGDAGQLVGPDLVFNEHAVDAFVLRLMAAVREVQESWPGGLEAVAVEVDGTPVPLDGDGRFSVVVDGQADVVVRWGGWDTHRALSGGEEVAAW